MSVPVLTPLPHTASPPPPDGFAVRVARWSATHRWTGVGLWVLAIAVLIDATLVRGVLLPAAMAVLGERTWWLPRWLGWLPTASH